jgi:hypothetical protein
MPDNLTALQDQVFDFLGSFWVEIFQEADLVDGIANGMAISLQALQTRYENLPKQASRKLIPLTEESTLRAFFLSEQDMEVVPHVYGATGLAYGDGKLYGVPSGTGTAYRFPWNREFTPAFLATGLNAGFTALQKDQEYIIYPEEGYIDFMLNPFTIENSMVIAEPAREENDKNTYLVLQFLGVDVERDAQVLQDFYGFVADITSDSSSEVYREAVQLAWDLKVWGATEQTLKNILALGTDSGLAPIDGTVDRIFYEDQYVWVLIGETLTSAPASVPPLVEEGQEVEEGDQLFDTFNIQKASQAIELSLYSGLHLPSGFWGGNMDGSIFIPDEFSGVSLETAPGWTELSILITGP